ncbi:MAG: response regulator receiver protein [Bacteroidetes bacterium]|nr:MAG: response regulator receiver protein [Bacteroidota bacterium]
MTKKLDCILLIDDDEPTNFLHRIILEDHAVSKNIEIAETVKEALQLLDCPKIEGCENPDLVFLDLNMPGMSGWDFLKKFHESKKSREHDPLVYILTTSANPDDKKRASGIKEVAGFLNKPLTGEIVEEIMHRHFSV